jgi:isoleucyl-tRNA synthetase
MSVARAVVGLARKLREEHRIKVRQPLGKLTVIHRDKSIRDSVTASLSLIAEEVNVKEVEVEADEGAFTIVTVKPNHKTLGRRCGAKLPEITAILKTWGFGEVTELESGEAFVVAGEALRIEDVLLQRTPKGDSAVASDGRISVALDTRIDQALRLEGIAREFISSIQNARKDAGFDITDRVSLTWQTDDDVTAAALRAHKEAIAKEVLAVRIDEGNGSSTVDINGAPVRFTLRRFEA